MGQQFKVGDTGPTREGGTYEITSVTGNFIYRGMAQPIEARITTPNGGGDAAAYFYPDGHYFNAEEYRWDLLPPTGNVNAPTAESLLLALGTASRELDAAFTAERDAHAAVEAAATRRARASEAHAEALKAVREAAWARAA